MLAKEEELLQLSQKVTAERASLPMTLVAESYSFTGPNGTLNLKDLFEDKHQLIMQHVMFEPDKDAGCEYCQYHLDNLPANFKHLYEANTMYVIVTRAPYEKMAAFYKDKLGSQVPYYSSFGSKFNYDYNVTLDPDVKKPVYNFKETNRQGEQPGLSVFYRDGDEIYHTYSSFDSNLDLLMPTAALLDLTPLGRQD